MMKQSKRFFSFLAAACLVCGLAACGSGGIPSEQNPAPEPDSSQSDVSTQTPAPAPAPLPEAKEPQDEETKILVAYFSATGTTKGVAEQIAALTGGDLYEIVPAKPYTDADLNYNDSSSRSTIEMDDPNARPEIGGEELSLDGYATLYLGYPIWHGQAPRIMRTFVERYDLDGLTVIPFCTSGGSGLSTDGIRDLAAGANWLEGRRFTGGASRSDVESWVESMA